MATTEVLIDDLILDLGNPRFDGLESQREALEKILVNQGKKLVNLAEDIATQGLSPAHRMIAIKSKGLKGKFTVMDGNRRLTALKILSNPAVLDPMSDVGDVTKRQLRNIAARFERTTVEPIDVHVCESDQEARHWIEAIHTGENDGRGVVDWDGIATARFRGKTSSLKVLEFVKARGKLDEAELAQLERFPITNLDRLVATREVRERLGLELESGELSSDLPATELVRTLRRIVTDIGSKKVTVKHLKEKGDRLAYITSLGTALPDLAKRTGASATLENLASSAVAKGLSAKSASTRTPTFAKRKALVPAQSQCKLTINDAKLEGICLELRRLPLDSYPIAIGALFRIFLELSLDHFGTRKPAINKYSVDATLKAKVDLVAAELETAGMIRRDLQPFRALASNANKGLSIDRLHGIIHNKYALPTAVELRSGWDEVSHVFREIWK